MGRRKRTPESIAADLADRADHLEAAETLVAELYRERLALWIEGRDLGMTQGALARPSRVSEGAVTQALRKVRLAEAVNA